MLLNAFCSKVNVARGVVVLSKYRRHNLSVKMIKENKAEKTPIPGHGSHTQLHYCSSIAGNTVFSREPDTKANSAKFSSDLSRRSVCTVAPSSTAEARVEYTGSLNSRVA